MLTSTIPLNALRAVLPLAWPETQAEPYEVWLDEWRVEQIGEDQYSLFASQEGISINLTFN